MERLPSGSWQVKVYAGTDPLTGREIRLRKTCKTERAAQIERGKLLEQAAAKRQPETDATVAQLMDRFLAAGGKCDLSAACAARGVLPPLAQLAACWGDAMRIVEANTCRYTPDVCSGEGRSS
jgi:hypothetical protein